MRAPFQVLVLPYRITDGGIEYCIFFRSDLKLWQFISGGGEDSETPAEAAKREAFEEAGFENRRFFGLDTRCSISSTVFGERARRAWGEDCFVVTEYAFAVESLDRTVKLSHEHLEYRWADYETARSLLRYDSNKTALCELDRRIRPGRLNERELR